MNQKDWTKRSKRWKGPRHNTPAWKTCSCSTCISERLRRGVWGLADEMHIKYKERFGQRCPFPLCDDLVIQQLEHQTKPYLT